MQEHLPNALGFPAPCEFHIPSDSDLTWCMTLTIPCACSGAQGCCMSFAVAALALASLKLGAMQVRFLLVFLQRRPH